MVFLAAAAHWAALSAALSAMIVDGAAFVYSQSDHQDLRGRTFKRLFSLPLAQRAPQLRTNGSMVLYRYCVSFFRLAGRKNDT